MRKLLDLFCCEGGAATGYARAGFLVTGVDIAPQYRYPYNFALGDALEYVAARHGEFDAIHASPPCQSYSRSFKHLATPRPMLIDATRDALNATGLPWVIENVEGAPMGEQDDLFGALGTMLCGTAFGLPVWRHRLFETSFPVTGPGCRHRGHAMNPHNVAGRERIYAEHGRGRDPEIIWADAMGVGWMSRHGARESIPPVFTEHIGQQLAAFLDLEAVA